MIELGAIPAICRDPDDDKVVATAIQGRADYLLTADEDIRVVDVYEFLHRAGIQVMTIDEFIVQLDQQHKR